ncbi:hypothetical protein FRB94_011883 [Tulasnella sp. JGI-2019a]|nr:hypothetical protein FRB94_011883 [Tulasnella sp. JGI-2019a]KAG9014430.1 hypothetical protein FRB93_013555 [Tulasnella sp. JGI-2019a]KAG9039689.1 hypothetical protein FRB95_007116 [Tulasnella sp. JGI-2019a]
MLTLPTVMRPGKVSSGWNTYRRQKKTIAVGILFVITLTLLIIRIVARNASGISFYDTGPVTVTPSVPDLTATENTPPELVKQQRNAGNDKRWMNFHPSGIGASIRRPRHHSQHRGAKMPPGEKIPLVAPLPPPSAQPSAPELRAL